MLDSNKILIGRKEVVSFPEFGFEAIDAKIDTGAYTSALHCHDIYTMHDNGVEILHFKLLDDSHPDYSNKDFKYKKFDRAIVKSSSGQTEERYKIKTIIKVGNTAYKTEFTLTNRSDMKYPVLIGRKLLKGKFIVDVSHKYLLNNIK